MSIYDLEFDQFEVDILPPDKRGNNNIAILNALFAPIQQDHDALFDSYRLGTGAGAYSSLNTYNLGDQVIFRKSVYQSVIDENNTDPTNTDNWVLIQENFIGILERIAYTGQVLVLTFALNKWFGTNFRQPPDLSEIFLTNGDLEVTGFVVGLTEYEDPAADPLVPVSSWVGADTSSAPIGGQIPFSKQVGFAVHMPVEVYESLDPDPNNRDSIVRSFIDLYALAGIKYEIITY